MRRAFRRECRLTSRATFFFAQATTFVCYSLGSIILTVWLDLALLDSSMVTLLIHASGSMESRRACSSPSFQSSTLRRKRVYFPRKSRHSRRRISRPSCSSLMDFQRLAATCGASTRSCSLSHFLASLRVLIFPSLVAMKY